MKTKFLLSFAFGFTLMGCHAQVKPTTHTVTESWKAPAATSTWTGCTTAAPCTYILSRITADSSGSCPAIDLTNLNYTPLNQSSPTSALTYTDTTASGLTVCYIVQTSQGGALSQPSNIDGPKVVPGVPIAPTLSGTVN